MPAQSGFRVEASSRNEVWRNEIRDDGGVTVVITMELARNQDDSDPGLCQSTMDSALLAAR